MSIDSRFVKLGSQAPAFELRSVSGELVTLEKYLGKKNVVLVFLRGFA